MFRENSNTMRLTWRILNHKYPRLVLESAVIVHLMIDIRVVVLYILNLIIYKVSVIIQRLSVIPCLNPKQSICVLKSAVIMYLIAKDVIVLHILIRFIQQHEQQFSMKLKSIYNPLLWKQIAYNIYWLT